jgi:uncharacterized protein
MNQAPPNPDPPPAGTQQGKPANQPASTEPRNSPWLSQPWVPFVVPLAVFMLVGSFEPTPNKPFELFGWTITYANYPAVYAVKLALTAAAMAQVSRGYRQFPFRVSPVAIAVGAVGVVIWIGLCKLGLESRLLGPLGLGWLVDAGQRSAFDPFATWPDQPAARYGFLGLRFLGLALVVPIIEEFFLRGFVMRFVVAADWWRVPFGTLTPSAVAIGTLLPVLMHPGEALAAAVWFSLVTWLMWRTKNIWDCVAAHAVTNLLLGIYVVAMGEWQFW